MPAAPHRNPILVTPAPPDSLPRPAYDRFLPLIGFGSIIIKSKPGCR